MENEEPLKRLRKKDGRRKSRKKIENEIIPQKA